MTPRTPPAPLRHLVVVLGDQLDPAAAALDGFDPARDAIWMAEVTEESTHVWSGKARIALFLSALRHFRDAIGQTLRLGYAHHIQRLMVTGLYALMLGVEPRRVHEWYLAVYVDAVEWVELPNTIGMSQYADGGILASRPYVATGKCIQRMSDHCSRCRFDPAKSTGDDACPFTTLYWEFLMRHEELLAGNQRMALQVRNLGRLSADDRAAITARAAEIRSNGGAPARPLTLL